MQATSGDDAIILPLVQPTSTQRGTHFQVGGQGDSIIMDFASKTSTVLWPDQKYYSTAPMKKLMPAELYGLYASIHPQDVDDACGEWMRRPGAEGESCRNLGREKVNGRNTVKYELSCYGEICRLWIDNELRVLVSGSRSGTAPNSAGSRRDRCHPACSTFQPTTTTEVLSLALFSQLTRSDGR